MPNEDDCVHNACVRNYIYIYIYIYVYIYMSKEAHLQCRSFLVPMLPIPKICKQIIMKCRLECVNRLIQELRHCDKLLSPAEPLSLGKPGTFTIPILVSTILIIPKISKQLIKKYRLECVSKIIQVLRHC